MFLMDKSIARKKKAEAVKGIMGDLKMSVTTTQLFVVLAENGRMAEASKVIDMFAAQMMASKGQVPAQVTSAEPLEKAELDELTKTLKGLIGKGETLLLTQKVHSALRPPEPLLALRALSKPPCRVKRGAKDAGATTVPHQCSCSRLVVWIRREVLATPLIWNGGQVLYDGLNSPHRHSHHSVLSVVSVSVH